MTAETHPATIVHASPEALGRTQRLGVLLLIVGDAAFLLSLVFSYLYLRALNTEHGWVPPHGRTVPIGLGWVIAAVMVVSLAFYYWAETGAARPRRLQLGLLLASLLVLVGLVLQAYQLATAGIVVADGSYASTWYALAGYHAFHLLLTLFIGIGIWNRARMGRYATDGWQVRLVGYWWAWVAVAAILTAATTSLAAIPHVVP
ncbi:cytochrome c oxidase subunit 3 [Oryzihumus sp.]